MTESKYIKRLRIVRSGDPNAADYPEYDAPTWCEAQSDSGDEPDIYKPIICGDEAPKFGADASKYEIMELVVIPRGWLSDWDEINTGINRNEFRLAHLMNERHSVFVMNYGLADDEDQARWYRYPIYGRLFDWLKTIDLDHTDDFWFAFVPVKGGDDGQ